MIGDSNDETNFLDRLLLLLDTNVSLLCKAFATVSSANIKLLKTQLSKKIQLAVSFLIQLQIFYINWF